MNTFTITHKLRRVLLVHTYTTQLHPNTDMFTGHTHKQNWSHRHTSTHTHKTSTPMRTCPACHSSLYAHVCVCVCVFVRVCLLWATLHKLAAYNKHHCQHYGERLS